TIAHIGVAVFFFISGFFIHFGYQSSTRYGFKGFFLRRFFPIFPAYLGALLFFFFIDPAPRLGFPTSRGLLQFFRPFFFVPNFLDYRYFLGINGVFWSIAVEVQLYALYPLLLLIVRRVGWKGALILTAILELTLRGICGAFDISPYAPWTMFFRLPFSFWFSW